MASSWPHSKIKNPTLRLPFKQNSLRGDQSLVRKEERGGYTLHIHSLNRGIPSNNIQNRHPNFLIFNNLFCLFIFFFLFIDFGGYYIVRTDECQPRPKYIFNKCGTNIYLFTLQRFGPSPSPNFKKKYICWHVCM